VKGTAISSRECLLSRTANPGRQEFLRLAGRCSFPPIGAESGPRLFVLGDSHAAALLPLENRLKDLGLGLTHLSKAGCPFPGTTGGHALRGCTQFQRRSEAFVLKHGRSGDAVLIGSYHLAHLGDDDLSRSDFLGAEGRPITKGSRKLGMYGRALARFATAARSRGLNVVVLGAGPRLQDRDRCLPEWFRSGERELECERSFRRDQRAARRMNRLLASRLPEGVGFVDLLEVLCNTGCTRRDMRRLLIDEDHLSEEAVLRLQAAVRLALAPPAPPGEEGDARLTR
jgi:hypothetical protein